MRTNPWEEGGGECLNALLPEAREKLIEHLIVESKQSYGSIESLGKALTIDELKHWIGYLLDLDDQRPWPPVRYDQELAQQIKRTQDLLKAVSSENLAAAIIQFPGPLSSRHAATLADLLAMHAGGHEYERSRFILSSETREELRKVIGDWIKIIREDDEFQGDRISDIATILGRLGRDEDLELLGELLDVEIERHRRTREMFLKWLHDGRRGPQPHESQVSYFNRYQAAFVGLSAPGTIELMLSRLDNEEFATEAVIVIAMLMRDDQPTRAHRIGGPDFSGVIARRQKRAQMAGTEEPHPYVRPILEKIEHLTVSEDEKTRYHAQTLAAVAVNLDYGADATPLIRALSVGGRSHTKLRGFTNLVLKGEMVPGSVIASCYDAEYAEWEKEPWRQSEDWYRVREWLELIIYSDAPEMAFDRIRNIPENFKSGWNINEIVQALGFCGAAGALDTLIELKPHMIGQEGFAQYWIDAIISHQSEAGMTFLADLIQEPDDARHLTGYYTSKAFAVALGTWAQSHTSFRTKLLEFSEKLIDQSSRIMLAAILAKVGDDETLIAAVNLFLQDDGSFPYPSGGFVEDALNRHVPISEDGSTYEIQPASGAGLRKHLFGIVCEDPERQAAASRILNWIDKLRDEYGRPIDEPRHPDIASGKPWPLEVLSN